MDNDNPPLPLFRKGDSGFSSLWKREAGRDLKKLSLVQCATLVCKKTDTALWGSCSADQPSKLYEVEVKGERLSLGNKGLHPSVGLFRIESIRNETKALAHPENVGIDGKCLPVEAEQEEAVNGLGADPLEAPECFFDLFGVHLF